MSRHYEQHFEEEFLAGRGYEQIRNYTYIVAIADNISSKERDEGKNVVLRTRGFVPSTT